MYETWPFSRVVYSGHVYESINKKWTLSYKNTEAPVFLNVRVSFNIHRTHWPFVFNNMFNSVDCLSCVTMCSFYIIPDWSDSLLWHVCYGVTWRRHDIGSLFSLSPPCEVISLTKGQWCDALMYFVVIVLVSTNCGTNSHVAGDFVALWCHCHWNAWRHQTITRSNVDISSQVFRGIHLRAISQILLLNLLRSKCV